MIVKISQTYSNLGDEVKTNPTNIVKRLQRKLNRDNKLIGAEHNRVNKYCTGNRKEMKEKVFQGGTRFPLILIPMPKYFYESPSHQMELKGGNT